MTPKRTTKCRKKTVDQLGRWPAVKDVVRARYCPYGEKKLKALVMSGKIRGGTLDDGNGTVFIDLDALDEHMQSLCILDIDEKSVGQTLKDL